MELKLQSIISKSILFFGVFNTLSANAAYTLIDLTQDYGFQSSNGYTSSAAYAINNSGQVVVGKTASMGQNGFVVFSTSNINHPAVISYTFGGDRFNYGNAREISNDEGLVPYSRLSQQITVGVYDTKTSSNYNTGDFRGYSGWLTPKGVNDKGQVVGTDYTDGGNKSNASLLSLQNGKYTPILLSTPTGVSSTANDINNAGQIVGSLGGVAALWNGDIVTTLGASAGYNQSNATAINDAGQIIGNSSLSTDPYAVTHATMWSNNQAIELSNLGGASSQALAINKSGDIVGSSDLSSNKRRATLWNNGGIVDLNTQLNNSTDTTKWILSIAYGINDSGWIVGEGTFNGSQKAFLLIPDATSTPPIPTPLPAAIWLFGSGVVGLLSLMRKRKTH